MAGAFDSGAFDDGAFDVGSVVAFNHGATSLARRFVLTLDAVDLLQVPPAEPKPPVQLVPEPVDLRLVVRALGYERAVAYQGDCWLGHRAFASAPRVAFAQRASESLTATNHAQMTRTEAFDVFSDQLWAEIEAGVAKRAERKRELVEVLS